MNYSVFSADKLYNCAGPGVNSPQIAAEPSSTETTISAVDMYIKSILNSSEFGAGECSADSDSIDELSNNSAVDFSNSVLDDLSASMMFGNAANFGINTPETLPIPNVSPQRCSNQANTSEMFLMSRLNTICNRLSSLESSLMRLEVAHSEMKDLMVLIVQNSAMDSVEHRRIITEITNTQGAINHILRKVDPSCEDTVWT